MAKLHSEGHEHKKGGKRSERVADQLHSIAIHLLRRLRKLDDAAGLGAPKLSALSVIVFGGPITLGELAHAEQVTPPTVTHLVRALEANGLVTREVDASDRRITRIRATEEGTKLLKEGRRRRVAVLAQAIKARPGGERRVLRDAARILEEIIGELDPIATPQRDGQ